MSGSTEEGLDIRARVADRGDNEYMLSSETIVDREGVVLADVRCRHEAGRGQTAEWAGGHALVFVRRGCFVRSADGREQLLDPTTAYCINPGEEERYDHPHDHGDDCTALNLAPGLVASLWGGEANLPDGPLPSSPGIDVEHRLLLAGGRNGAEPHGLVERAILLVAHVLEHADAGRVACGRPSSVRSRRRVVDGTREALAADPGLSLIDLSRLLATSPHHLSRVFRAGVGHTISRHRMRLRVRAALEQVAGGEHDLARLAGDLGFADQSHLCRVIRAETGQTPSALRRALLADAGHGDAHIASADRDQLRP